MPELNYRGHRGDGTRTLRSVGGEVSGNFFGQSSFASHVLTYERNLVRVPDDVPLEIMGPLGCGIQTGAGAVMRSLDARPGSSIVIAGGGAVGLSAVMAAKIQRCATIVLIEPMANRRDLGASLGATHCIDPATHTNIVTYLQTIAPSGLDYALDTSGSLEILGSLAESLGSKGVLGILAASAGAAPLPVSISRMITLGLTVRGIIEGDSNPRQFIPELIEHYRGGRLPFDRLIKTYQLGDINKAIKDQHEGACVKAILIPSARATMGEET